MEDYRQQRFTEPKLHIKQCFCIGPEKCEDKTCRIVQDYLKNKGKITA